MLIPLDVAHDSVRLQIATSLLIVGMGVVLTIRAASELAALPAG